MCSTTLRVVGDEEIGQAELLLQVLQQVDHLGLDRHVERRHRLVADDQLGLDGERAGDADALALAAREFVREAVHVVGLQADRLEQLRRRGLPSPSASVASLWMVSASPMIAPTFMPRVQRGVGVLEDDLHVAAQRTQVVAVHAPDVGALEPDLARAGLDQPQDAAAGRRLAAARFAHQAQGLALADVEADAVDGVNLVDGAREDAALDREVLAQVADLEEVLGDGGMGARS